jgi:hypothetical protein
LIKCLEVDVQDLRTIGTLGPFQDSFYRKHTQEEIDLAFKSELDLDHPDAIDTDLFVKVRDVRFINWSGIMTIPRNVSSVIVPVKFEEGESNRGESHHKDLLTKLPRLTSMAHAWTDSCLFLCSSS